MQEAFNISQRSHCMEHKVGAVIACTEKGKQSIIKDGYNGPVKDAPHCDELGKCSRGNPKCVGSHAEINAIGNAASSSANITGAILFVTLSPCVECAKHVVNTGLSEVIYMEDYGDVCSPKKEEAEMALDIIRRSKICTKFKGRIIAPDPETKQPKIYYF
jgi:dCMP deaminase